MSVENLDKFFNQLPGSNESYLKFNYVNPFIVAENNDIIDNLSVELIVSAQGKDKERIKAFTEDLVQVVTDISNLKPNEESDVILLFKSKLDLLYHQCSRLADNQFEHKKAIISLINIMMKSVWDGAKGDAKAEEKLQDEEIAREIHFELLESRLIAEIIAEDSVYTEQDLVPLVLTLSSSDLTPLFNLFDSPQQKQLIASCQRLLAQSKDLTTAVIQAASENINLMQELVLEK